MGEVKRQWYRRWQAYCVYTRSSRWVLFCSCRLVVVQSKTRWVCCSFETWRVRHTGSTFLPLFCLFARPPTVFVVVVSTNTRCGAEYVVRCAPTACLRSISGRLIDAPYKKNGTTILLLVLVISCGREGGNTSERSFSRLQ